MKRLIALLCGSFVVAECALAQDLAEAARRERERRKTVGKGEATKVVTDEELRNNRGQLANDPSIPPAVALDAPGEISRSTRATATAGNSGSASSTPTTAPSGGSEGTWRAGIRALHQKIASLEGEVSTLDAQATRLAYGVATAWRYGKESAGERQLREGINAARQMAWQQDRTEVLARLDRARASLAKARADLETFEESARRQGIPPGWLRY